MVRLGQERMLVLCVRSSVGVVVHGSVRLKDLYRVQMVNLKREIIIGDLDGTKMKFSSFLTKVIPSSSWIELFETMVGVKRRL